MKKIKITGLLLLVLMLIIVSYATIDDQINENLKRLEEVNKLMEGVDQERLQTENSQTQVEKDIKKLEKDIRDKEVQIEALSIKVVATEAEIVITTQELADAEKEVAFQNERMNKRLRTMYKSGNFGYLEVLLGAEDFSDLLTRMDMIQLLLDYDKDMLKALKIARDLVIEKKAQLEIEKNSLEVLLADREKQRAELNASLKVMESKKGELAKHHAALERQLDALNEDSEKITEIISKLELRKKYVGGKMMWPLPLDQTRITSEFGMRVHPILGTQKLHTGIDIGAPNGTPVYAAQAGQVFYAGWLGSYGRVVMLDHGGGIVTIYAHNSALVVSKGDEVKKGDVLAKVGSTGSSTGNHLHFEVRLDGVHQDPYTYVTNPGY